MADFSMPRKIKAKQLFYPAKLAALTSLYIFTTYSSQESGEAGRMNEVRSHSAVVHRVGYDGKSGLDCGNRV